MRCHFAELGRLGAKCSLQHRRCHSRCRGTRQVPRRQTQCRCSPHGHCDEYLQRCMLESESIIEEAMCLPRHSIRHPALFVQPRGSLSTTHTDVYDSFFHMHLLRGEKIVRVWPTGTALYEVAGEPTEAHWHLARFPWQSVLLSRLLTWFARLGARPRLASRYLIHEYIPTHCKRLSEWLGCEQHHCSDSWIGHSAGGAAPWSVAARAALRVPSRRRRRP